MADQKASADTVLSFMAGSEHLLALDATPDNVTIPVSLLASYVQSSIRAGDPAPKTPLIASPTNATVTTLTQTGAAYTGAGDSINISAGSIVSFEGFVLAKKTGASGAPRSMWHVQGLITVTTSAADIEFIGTPTVTMLFQDAGASAWAVAVAVDATNGNLKVNVTGDAGFTTNWQALIETNTLF